MGRNRNATAAKKIYRRPKPVHDGYVTSRKKRQVDIGTRAE
jgi:hypothetical protein